MKEINTIYNEDCLETMRNLNKEVDLVITSPPYNIIRKNLTDRGYDTYKDDKNNEDYIKWILDIFIGYDNILKDNGCVLFNLSYGTENTILMSLVIAEIIKNSNFILADIIVWKKKSSIPNNVSSNKLTRIVEYIYVFCRKNEFSTFNCNKQKVNQRDTGQVVFENIFNFIEAKNNDKSTHLNKATFSTDLVRRLLKIYAKENSLVYDGFMGTGTTEEACIIENINFIGSEISKEQCNYANKRINQRLTQPTIF